ncbi:MAG TPA: ABC transporter ATP-binding protein [Chitinophagaceae bacterium]|nr:ABC transporter ATP-binding protein [Chitinophagaceae bacterium]
MKIVLDNIEKKFNKDLLFSGININFEVNNRYALMGANGSGKSTLLQIISSYISPSKGQISYFYNNQKIEENEVFHHVSIVAPYLELIEEMTLTEFLEYHFSFKQKLISINEMIDYVGLNLSKNKPIEKFSSGMKQRVKLLQAFMSNSPILLLDEPCSNLDQAGFETYTQLMNNFSKNKIVIVASNDLQEIKPCNHQINISDYKNSNGAQ